MNRRTVFIYVLVLALVSALVFSAAGAASVSGKQAGDDNDRFVVIFANDTGKYDAKKYVRQKGGEVLSEFSIVPGMAVRLGEDKVAGLKSLKGVKAVGPDVRIHAVDTELDNSWGVKRIGAGIVHDYNRGQGVKVVIVDTGVDYKHPDLDDNYAGGYDFVNNDLDPMDDNGHGTHVAGTAAAEDNGFGVVGVAPEASIYALKVLDSSGSGYFSDVVRATQWCVEYLSPSENFVVVNMSFGSSQDPGAYLHDAIKTAYEAGVVLVAAAGNSGNARGAGDNIIYPARYDEVIAVGATDSNDNRARFSSTGSQLELMAPGVDIISCFPGGGYATASGTSMASPHVAGTAALVLSNGMLSDLNGDRVTNNKDLRLLLRQTADDLGAAGWDSLYGFGLVDADEAAPRPSVLLGTISGTVTDLNNNPIPWATVTVTGSDFTWSTTAIDNGRYTIPGIPPGEYTVTASAELYQSSSTAARVLENQTITVDFRLTAVHGGSIAGTVYDTGNNCIANAAVDVRCTSYSIPLTWSVTTDLNGNYVLISLPLGNYQITASAEGYHNDSKTTTVYENQVSTVNLYLAPVLNGAISGSVTDVTGKPIAGATVSDGARNAATSSDGSYTIYDVPAGQYTVTASATGYESSVQSVTVVEGETSTADFTLTPLTTTPTVKVAYISYATEGGRYGTAHLLITVSLVDGTGSPVSGASVAAAISNGSKEYYCKGTTGAEGKVTFKITNAPSGTYTTKVTDVQAAGLTWDGVTPENSFTK